MQSDLLTLYLLTKTCTLLFLNLEAAMRLRPVFFLLFFFPFREPHSTAGSIMGPAVAQNYLLCSSPHKRGWPGRHGNTTDAWPWHLKDLCLSRGSRARERWAEYYEAGSVMLCS